MICDSKEKEVPRIYNVYCDESCHLEHDHFRVMGFGAITVEKSLARSISKELHNLKISAGCRGELKWSKVSPKNVSFYCDIVDYFFSKSELSFRALVVNGKERLNHAIYNEGSHDLFYYKMYYYLLRNIIEYDPQKELQVYIDIKDTQSSRKVAQLRDVLCNSFHDFDHHRVTRIQQIRSNESELLQLADFLLGALIYNSRKLSSSMAKQAVVKRIREHTRHPLMVSTVPWEQKFNIYHFWPRKDS